MVESGCSFASATMPTECEPEDSGNQPDPVAGADHVVGREPARRRLAARPPGGVARPVVDRDPVAACGTRRRWRRGRSPPPGRAFASAGRRGRRRRRASALRSRVRSSPARQSTRCSPPLSLSAMSWTRAPSTKCDAAALRLLAEEVLEDAAIDLVARHREVAAGADLGHRVDVAPALRREEAKAELLELAFLHVLLQAEHLAEVVGADLDRRLADLVRGFAAPDGGGARAPGCRARRSAASAAAPG